jgi:hypothetical protein
VLLYAYQVLHGCNCFGWLNNANFICLIRFETLGIYSDYAMGWTIGVLGFDSRQGLGIFLFTTASRTALGTIQPPIQWVPGALSLWVERLRREADHSPPSSVEVKEWVELYFHSPNTLSWRGAQFKKNTGITLLLSLRSVFSQQRCKTEYFKLQTNEKENFTFHKVSNQMIKEGHL